MWYNNKVTKQLILVAAVTVMCMAAFAFGSGFASVGTLNTTDSNRFVVFTSKAQLDEYVATHEGDFFNVPSGERGNYDDKFFETNALVMLLTDGMSGSIKVSCEGYKLQGNELHVTVKELSPQIHTMDIRYNTLCVAVSREQASAITKVVIESHRIEI